MMKYSNSSPSPEAVRRLENVIECESYNFANLVESAGLCKASDFIEADLAGMDFSESDLRGFNFSGADLSNTHGLNYKIDETTNLSGANVTGSVFALEKEKRDFFDLHREHVDLFKRLQKDYWAHGSLWVSENLNKSSKNFAQTSKIAKYLYAEVTDQTYKNQILYFLRNTFSSARDYKDFLIAQASDSTVAYRTLRGVLDILGKSFARDETVKKMLLLYLRHENKEIRKLCVPPVMAKAFFARNRDLIIPIVEEESDPVIRKLFTEHFAIMAGGIAPILLYRQDIRSYHDYGQPIDNRLFEAMITGLVRARKIARAAQNIQKGTVSPSDFHVGMKEILRGMFDYQSTFLKLKGYGLPLQLDYSLDHFIRLYKQRGAVEEII